MMPADMVEHFLHAFLGGDGDAAASYVTEDFRLIAMPMAPLVLSGRDALRFVVEQTNSGFPRRPEECSHVITRSVAADALVMHERIDRFLWAGEWLELHIAAIFEFRDGLIATETDYFDRVAYAPMMARAGVEVPLV
jgi:limonene-1,2-epoxide hydrolase